MLTLDYFLTSPTDGFMVYADTILHTIFTANLNGTGEILSGLCL